MLSTSLSSVWLGLFLAAAASGFSAEELIIDDSEPLALPKPGAHALRILAPQVLELTLVTRKEPDPAPAPQWNFVATNGVLSLPAVADFVVTSDGKKAGIERVGFKRRVLYAPLRERDLRIDNKLYLLLKTALTENSLVDVKNPSGQLWPANQHFTQKMDPLRWSPALHVNQLGYLPGGAKRAMAGSYLGSLDELKITGRGTNWPVFSILDMNGGKVVFSGELRPRPDKGFTFPCYQNVWDADFTPLQAPGNYRLMAPQMGVSFPFWIGEGVAGVLARSYALGCYHQRCGTNNVMPYTRHNHDACHTAPAAVPLPEKDFARAWAIIAGKTTDATNNSRHVAAPIKDSTSCLYPFVRQGELDVSGGHHDAGDYSKYTINSALFIHHLVFAADTFRGVADLDNLGLPESGDGKSDILQEAKWEADFLAKMQDDDGGFYFLVYPREREYEDNVLPEKGDRQIVWPKTTAVTAAAVAALAQCASSPVFKKQFPAAAVAYLGKAKKGWAFLQRAIDRFGSDGAYQKITHYGDQFMHDDELAWATCEMFIATGDQTLHTKLRRMFNPADPHTRRWGWWQLCEGYGCAIRSYVFAATSGKLSKGDLDLAFFTKCEKEIISTAENQLRRADDCAYGTSFPAETKRVRSAGWSFSCDPAFDLAVAFQLDYPVKNDPRRRFMDAILSNFNYQLGCNPVNVCYLTGIGSRRPRELVHHYALNDRRLLPPGGIPIGDIQSEYTWMDFYKRELGALSFPRDGDARAPYPIYDRWADSFNLSTEFVILNQARGLAAAAFLFAQTSLRSQPWNPVTALILPAQNPAQPGQGFELRTSTSDSAASRIVWEASGEEPTVARTFIPRGPQSALTWIEAEAILPHGWLIFGQTNRPPAVLGPGPEAQ